MSVNYITSADNKLYQITWGSIHAPTVKVYDPITKTYVDAPAIQNALQKYMGLSSRTATFRGMKVNSASVPPTITLIYSNKVSTYSVEINASDSLDAGKVIPGSKKTLPFSQVEGVREFREGVNGTRIHFARLNNYFRFVLPDGKETRIHTNGRIVDAQIVSDKVGGRQVWALNNVGRIEVSVFDAGGKLLSKASRDASATINRLGSAFVALHTDENGRMLALDKSGYLHVFSEAGGVSGYYRSDSPVMSVEDLTVGRSYRMVLDDNGDLYLSGGEDKSRVIKSRNVADLVSAKTKEYLFDTVTLGPEKRQFRTEDGKLYSRVPGEIWVPRVLADNGHVSGLTYNADGSASAVLGDNTVLHMKADGTVTAITINSGVPDGGHLLSATISDNRVYFTSSDGQIHFQGVDGASPGAFSNDTGKRFASVVAANGKLYGVTAKGDLVVMSQPAVGDLSPVLTELTVQSAGDSVKYTDLRLAANNSLMIDWESKSGLSGTYLGVANNNDISITSLVGGPVLGESVGEPQPIVTSDGRKYLVADGKLLYLNQSENQWVPTNVQDVVSIEIGADGKLYALHNNGYAISRLDKYGELVDTGESTTESSRISETIVSSVKISSFAVGVDGSGATTTEQLLRYVLSNGEVRQASLKETSWGAGKLGGISLDKLVTTKIKGGVKGGPNRTISDKRVSDGWGINTKDKTVFRQDSKTGEWQQMVLPEGNVTDFGRMVDGSLVVHYKGGTNWVYDGANWLEATNASDSFVLNAAPARDIVTDRDGMLHAIGQDGIYRTLAKGAIAWEDKGTTNLGTNKALVKLDILQDGTVVGRDQFGEIYTRPVGQWNNFSPDYPVADFNLIYDSLKQKEHRFITFNLPFKSNKRWHFGPADQLGNVTRQSSVGRRWLSGQSLLGAAKTTMGYLARLTGVTSLLGFAPGQWGSRHSKNHADNSDYIKALVARNDAWKGLGKSQKLLEAQIKKLHPSRERKLNALKAHLDEKSKQTITQIESIFGTKKPSWIGSKIYQRMQAFKKGARFSESNALKSLIRVRTEVFGATDPIAVRLQGLVDAGVYLPKYGSDLDVSIAKLALEQKTLMDTAAHLVAAQEGHASIPVPSVESIQQDYSKNPITRIHSSGIISFKHAKAIMKAGSYISGGIKDGKHKIHDVLNRAINQQGDVVGTYRNMIAGLKDGMSVTIGGGWNVSGSAVIRKMWLPGFGYYGGESGPNLSRGRDYQLKVSKSGGDISFTLERRVDWAAGLSASAYIGLSPNNFSTSVMVDDYTGYGYIEGGGGVAVTKNQSWTKSATFTVNNGHPGKLNTMLNGLIGGEWDAYEVMANSDEAQSDKTYSSTNEGKFKLGFELAGSMGYFPGSVPVSGLVRLAGVGQIYLEGGDGYESHSKYQADGAYQQGETKGRFALNAGWRAYLGLFSRNRLRSELDPGKDRLDSHLQHDISGMDRSGTFWSQNYSDRTVDISWNNDGTIAKVSWSLEVSRDKTLLNISDIKALAETMGPNANLNARFIDLVSFAAADTRQSIKVTLTSIAAGPLSEAAKSWIADMQRLSDFTAAGDRKAFGKLLKQAANAGVPAASITELKAKLGKNNFRTNAGTADLLMSLSDAALASLNKNLGAIKAKGGVVDPKGLSKAIKVITRDIDNREVSEIKITDSVDSTTSRGLQFTTFGYRSNASVVLNQTIGTLGFDHSGSTPTFTTAGDLLLNNTAAVLHARKAQHKAFIKDNSSIPALFEEQRQSAAERNDAPAFDKLMDDIPDRTGDLETDFQRKNSFDSQASFQDFVNQNPVLSPEELSLFKKKYDSAVANYNDALIGADAAEHRRRVISFVDGKPHYKGKNGLVQLTNRMFKTLIADNAEVILNTMHVRGTSDLLLSGEGLTSVQITALDLLPPNVNDSPNFPSLRTRIEGFNVLDLVSGAINGRALTPAQELILSNYFPDADGNLDRSQITQMASDAGQYHQFRENVLLLMQNVDVIDDQSLDANQAIEKLLSWEAITEEGGKNLIGIVDGIDPSYDAKRQMVSQSFYLGLGADGHPKGICGGLGAAYLAALAQGGNSEGLKNKFIDGLYDYAGIRERSVNNGSSALELGQASDFNHLINKMNALGAIGGGGQQSVMKSVESLTLTESVARLINASGDQYLQINTGNHAMFLAKKTINGSARMYFYDPNYGEVSLAVQGSGTQATFEKLIADHLNQTSSKGLWTGTLADYYQADTSGGLRFNAYEMDVAKVNNHAVFNDMKSLLTVDGFQSEFERLSAMPDVMLNGQKVAPRLLLAIGAEINGRPISAADLQQSGWDKKVTFNAAKLKEVLDVTMWKKDNVDILNVLRTVKESDINNVDLTTVDHQGLLHRLDKIRGANNVNNQALFDTLNNYATNTKKGNRYSQKFTKISNRLSSGVDKYDRVQTVMAIANYFRRDSSQKLSPKDQRDRDIGLGMAVGGLGLDLGGNVISSSIQKAGTSLANKFASATSAVGRKAAGFGRALAKSGGAIIAGIGSVIDIYGAYDAFSKLSDPNLSYDQRQDLMVAGGLSVAGAVTGIMTAAAIAMGAGAATMGIGALVGVALAIGGMGYSAVRETQALGRVIDLTPLQSIEAFFRSFLGLKPNVKLQNEKEFIEAKTYLREGMDAQTKYYAETVKGMFSSVNEVVYSKGGAITPEFAGYRVDVVIKLHTPNPFHRTQKTFKRIRPDRVDQVIDDYLKANNKKINWSWGNEAKVIKGTDYHYYNVGSMAGVNETVTSPTTGIRSSNTTVEHIKDNDFNLNQGSSLYMLGDGNDTVTGYWSRKNIFHIAKGKKTITGGDKNDTFILINDKGGANAGGSLDGGKGADTLILQKEGVVAGERMITGLYSQGWGANMHYSLNGSRVIGIKNIENVLGVENGLDLIIGGDENNVFDGRGAGVYADSNGSHRDQLFGNGGNDILTLHDETYANGGSGSDAFIVSRNKTANTDFMRIRDEYDAGTMNSIILNHDLDEIHKGYRSGENFVLVLNNGIGGSTTVQFDHAFNGKTGERTKVNYTLLTRDGFMLTPTHEESGQVHMDVKFVPDSARTATGEKLFKERMWVQMKKPISPSHGSTVIVKHTTPGSGITYYPQFKLPPHYNLMPFGTSGDDIMLMSDGSVTRGYAGNDIFVGSEGANTYNVAVNLEEVNNASISTDRFLLTDTGKKYIANKSFKMSSTKTIADSTLSSGLRKTLDFGVLYANQMVTLSFTTRALDYGNGGAGTYDFSVNGEVGSGGVSGGEQHKHRIVARLDSEGRAQVIIAYDRPSQHHDLGPYKVALENISLNSSMGEDINNEQQVIETPIADTVVFNVSRKDMGIRQEGNDVVLFYAPKPDRVAQIVLVDYMTDEKNRHYQLIDGEGVFYTLELNSEGKPAISDLGVMTKTGDEKVLGRDLIFVPTSKAMVVGDAADDEFLFWDQYGLGGRDSLSIPDVGGYILDGGAGNDRFNDNKWANTLIGGAGDDTFIWHGGDDLVLTGSGNDTVFVTENTDIGRFDGIITIDTLGEGKKTIWTNYDINDPSVIRGRVGDNLVIKSLVKPDNAISIVNYFTDLNRRNFRIGQPLRNENSIVYLEGEALWQWAHTEEASEFDDDILLTEHNLIWNAHGSFYIFDGLGGDDTIYDSTSRNDVKIFSGDGDDRVYAGEGNDYVETGAGNDFVDLGVGDDYVHGDDGNDEAHGGAGNDFLRGGRGDDILFGDTGNDVVYGGIGDDYLAGGAGNDDLWGAHGNDTLLGGAGSDILKGDVGDDVVSGDSGNDTLYGGQGNDILDGGAGDDKVYGGAGDDIIYYSNGTDILDGGVGNDVLSFVNAAPGSGALIDPSSYTGFESFIDFPDILLDKASLITKVFNFGAEHAGKMVTMNLDAKTLGGWDASAGSQDHFYVRANGLELLNRTASGIANHNLVATLDSTGKLTLDFETHGVVSGVNVENFVVTVLPVPAGETPAPVIAANGTPTPAPITTADSAPTNDVLVGTSGADTFVFGEGDGADVVSNADAADKVTFSSGVDFREVWFSREGDDLKARLLGSNDSISIDDWYLGGANQLAKFELSDGRQLLSANIPTLVTAMSAWAAVSSNNVDDLNAVPTDEVSLLAALTKWHAPTS